jgi:hypothetical protein
MKVRFGGFTALCCALALLASFSGSNSSHSQTQKVSTGARLSQAEQELLTEINHVRADPGAYATYLENLKPFFNGKDSLIEQRVKPFGTWQGAIGENLSYGNESARERILTWLIDDGFASRGHRKRLLSTDYRVAGLACGPHPEFGVMCCLTLARGFTDLQPSKSTTTTQTNTGKQTNNVKGDERKERQVASTLKLFRRTSSSLRNPHQKQRLLG